MQPAQHPCGGRLFVSPAAPGELSGCYEFGCLSREVNSLPSRKGDTEESRLREAP
jgi:hypothetical protein